MTFWIGDRVQITFILSAIMALFVIISTWNNIFAFFLNGIGKIKFSLYQSITAGIINIPLSIFFAKYLSLGINGVILGTIGSLLVSTILQPIQYYKIIEHKAEGIWNS